MAVFLLLVLLLRPLFQHFKVPQWSRNIIQEPLKLCGESVPHGKIAFTPSAVKLLVTSSIGFLILLFTVFHPNVGLWMAFPAATWGIACVLILISRPVTAPKALLVLFFSILIFQSLVLLDTASKLRQDDIPILLGTLTALAAISIIFNMPLRDPRLSIEKISPLFNPPKSSLRSPEDNLTMWQFMTVSWMAPLISLGNSRQLNDEDVWSLGYEFQHRLLLDRFSELKGTVLRRLLEANGIDLIIISILSIIELFASTYAPSAVLNFPLIPNPDFSAPVFLQKILQSMENPEAPKRAAFTYAALSLIVRLIAAQSSVFTLWYGRRCYERSRGELITMLYEKTLSRKVVSISTKARPEENGNASNGNRKQASRSGWKKALDIAIRPFRLCWSRPKATKTSDEKELATMGKILNLMR